MIRPVTLIIACLLCVACATSGGSFERHSLSRLSEVAGSGVDFVFETRAVPGLDRNDPAAEAMRMQWLSEWLEVRGVCAPGHEVTERREIAAQEQGFYDPEFRYAVRCRPASANGSSDSL